LLVLNYMLLIFLFIEDLVPLRDNFVLLIENSLVKLKKLELSDSKVPIWLFFLFNSKINF